MSYDAWKTRSPDHEHYYDYDERDCEHEQHGFETSVEGRRECCGCGKRWWPTKEELEIERRLECEYAIWERQQERREFWRRLTYPVRWPIYLLLGKIWPRKSSSVLTDDEIPF